MARSRAIFSHLAILLVLTTLLVVLQPIQGGGKKQHKNKYSENAKRRPSSSEPDLSSEEESIESIESHELDGAAAAAAADAGALPKFRQVHKPYRMAKLNLVWSKAQQRLTEPKLKSLYSDLKIQDKEELAWKQLNGQHADKDGFKEAALRQKLVGIMSTYDLLEHFDDTQDPAKHKGHKAYAGKVPSGKQQQQQPDARINRSLFKDKKLNKLWERAEVSGFTADELAALREEFVHHQDKVDMYYSVLEDSVLRRKDERHENAVNEDEFDRINQIQNAEEPALIDPANAARDADVAPGAKRNAYVDEANLLRDKHRDLRDNFDRLERISARGPDSAEFVEPKVQNLWRVASQQGSFTADELASLRVELLHFESRLLKLRHLHAEQALNAERFKDATAYQSKQDKYGTLDEHIKKELRKVEKMQMNLEERIFLHTEL